MQDFLGTSFLILYLFFWIFLVPCFLMFFYLHFLYTSCTSGFSWYLTFWYVIFDIWFSTYILYSVMDSLLSSYLFLTSCLYIYGSWHFLFLAFESICYFADNRPFFNEHLLELLALIVQSSYINCIWKYRFSR